MMVVQDKYMSDSERGPMKEMLACIDDGKRKRTAWHPTLFSPKISLRTSFFFFFFSSQ